VIFHTLYSDSKALRMLRRQFTLLQDISYDINTLGLRPFPFCASTAVGMLRCWWLGLLNLPWKAGDADT